MIDDVHERTVNTDLVLALLKKVRRKRPELKLIVSSATIQAEELAAYFQEGQFSSRILQIQGRTFPVDV
jgi:ATP-dependent RNA helicase DDX35